MPDGQQRVLLQCSEVSSDIQQKRPELWSEGNWMLHDGNAPSHRALIAHEFLGHNSIVTLSHPLCWPELAHYNFFPFLKMKLQLKGCYFDTVEIHCKLQKVHDTLGEQDFENASQQWQRRWECCIAAQRDYFKVPKLESSEYFLVYNLSLGTF